MNHFGIRAWRHHHVLKLRNYLGAIDELENNRKDVAHISAQVADLANVVLSIQNNLTNIFQALRDPTLPSILPQPPPMPQHPPPTSNQPPYPLGTPFSRYQGGPIRLEFPTIKGYNAEGWILSTNSFKT